MSALPFTPEEQASRDAIERQAAREAFGESGGLLSRLRNFIRAVADDREEAHTTSGRFAQLLEIIVGGRNKTRDYSVLASSDGLGTDGIAGNMQAENTNVAKQSLGGMLKQREAERAVNDPVAVAIEQTAKDLGVKWQDLNNAITTANAHVVPGQKSHAVEEVAGILGVSQNDLIKAAGQHGFGMKDGKIIIDANAARGNAQTSQASPEYTGKITRENSPVSGPSALPNAADGAIAAMANGTATRAQIQQFEQASIERLQERQERTGDANISRALGVMHADGEISKNEYKVYQAIIQKAADKGDINLTQLGFKDAKDIDTTQELGKAISAMSQQQSQGAQR